MSNPPNGRPSTTLLRDPAWAAALALACAAPIALRAWVNFRTPIPAGVDAGYYAVQARELLEHGRLAWTDVPLIFALDAAIAKLAMIVADWSIDDAVLWASRVVDSIGQPLVAIAVFAGAFAWSRGRRSAIPAAVAASLATTITPPILRMVGDFEKQSLAMVFMAAAWIALMRLLSATEARALRLRAAWTVGFLVLTALTHAGTFGAAAVGVVATLLAWALAGGLARSGLPRARIAQGAAIAAAVGAVLLVSVWLLAPLKVQALLNAPMKLFAGDLRGPGRGPLLVAWIAAVGACAVAIGWTMRRMRPDAAASDAEHRDALAGSALAVGLAATAAFLACPLIAGDISSRLSIMAPLPLAFVIAFVLASRAETSRGGRWRSAASPLASAALCIVAVATIRADGPQMISAEGFAELRGWRDELAARGTTVVAARHGLEFWAAFALDCTGRQKELVPSDFEKFERCYMLVESRGGPEGRRPRPPGPPPGGPPGMFGPAERDGEMRADPLAPARVPDSATVFKRGARFTLYELPNGAVHLPGTYRAPTA